MKIYLVLEDRYVATNGEEENTAIHGIFKTKERADHLLKSLGGSQFDEIDQPRFYISEFNTDEPELSVAEYEAEQAQHDAEFELLLAKSKGDAQCLNSFKN